MEGPIRIRVFFREDRIRMRVNLSGSEPPAQSFSILVTAWRRSSAIKMPGPNYLAKARKREELILGEKNLCQKML